MTSEIRMEFVGYYDGQKIVDSEGNEIKLEDKERQPCEIWRIFQQRQSSRVRRKKVFRRS